MTIHAENLNLSFKNKREKSRNGNYDNLIISLTNGKPKQNKKQQWQTSAKTTLKHVASSMQPHNMYWRKSYVREYVYPITTTPMGNIVYAITLCVWMLCWNGSITYWANLEIIDQAKTTAANHLNTRDPEEAIKLICKHPKKQRFPAKPKGGAMKIQETFKQLRSVIGTVLHLMMNNQITSWKRLFQENAEKTTYLILFYATPLSGELLYQRYQETINISSEEKYAAGEHPMYSNYIQIASIWIQRQDVHPG